MPTTLSAIPQYLLNHLEVVWTFLLLTMRFTGLLTTLPGIGAGQAGLVVRGTAIIAFSMASCVAGPFTAVPENWGVLLLEAGSEFFLGFLIGSIPLLMVTGVEMGANLSSMTMGLGAAHFFDPNLGTSVTPIQKILGDVAIIIFLFIGGHYVMIDAVAGLGGTIVPGSFGLSESSLNVFLDRSGDIFRAGVMVSAPVVVALMLTQFVMGLISKAVPTVNVLIVSFPLTIGIGLILTFLSLPELVYIIDHETAQLEKYVLAIMQDMKTLTPGP